MRKTGEKTPTHAQCDFDCSAAFDSLSFAASTAFMTEAQTTAIAVAAPV